MAKFRKKPPEFEAVRWEGPWHAMPGVVRVESLSGDPATAAGEQVRHYVATARGQRAYLSPGDWIVTAPDGSHFPYSDADFHAAFEPA